MYTGEVIDELLDLVGRAEQHARSLRMAEPAARAERDFTPQFLYPAESGPMMMGVA